MTDALAADRLVAAGLEHHNAGRLDAAAERYSQALEAEPKHGDALHLLGLVSHMRRDHGAARDMIERAIKVDRKQPDYHANLGRVLMALEQPSKAVEAFKKALRLQPGFTPARLALGSAFLEAGRAGEAVRLFRDVRKDNDRDPMAALGLATALRETGDLEAALNAYDEVLGLDGGLVRAHVDRGNILSGLGRHADALAAYDAAIAADPELVEAHANKGAILAELGDAEASAAAHGAARRIEPALTRSVWAERLALPIVYESSDQIDDARRRWARGMDSLDAELRLETPDEISHALLAVRSTPTFRLQYQGQSDVAFMARWAGLVRRVVEAACPHLCEPVSVTPPRKRVRVGFVSSFFLQHSIFRTHGAWITELDRTRFETYVFHTGSQVDDATQAIKRTSEKFFHMPGAGVADAERIKACDLDVLIHIDIGMDPVSQFLAALNLAPVQANGLGHPVTSGMASIDHALTSDLMEPAECAADYVEELVRLANLASCHADDGIPASPPPRSAGGDGPVFLCAQSLFKLLPEDDAVFAALARRTGTCRIQFIRHMSDHVNGIFQRRLAQAFEAEGLEASDHCVMLDRMDHRAFSRACGQADVMLDSFAWSGNTSTLDGLSSGTPVVTLPGKTMRSRHSAAILQRMGLDDLIAEDRESYVELAYKAACDAAWRSDVTHRLNENRALCYNDTTPVRDLERYLEKACERG